MRLLGQEHHEHKKSGKVALFKGYVTKPSKIVVYLSLSFRSFG